MNSPRIVVVVVTYDRPHALRDLLETLSLLRCPPALHPVDLVISRDGGGGESTFPLLRDDAWPHGKLTRISHPEHLGLREHVLRAGDLVDDYDALVMLEDDLLVSPALLEYLARALAAAADWEEVRQFALYSPNVAESYGLPFTPVLSGDDLWYARVPCSWGQCWTRRQWRDFRVWLRTHPTCPRLESLRHPAAAWGGQSWKKHFFEFLLQQDGWVLYPRESFSTNRGLPGVHFKREKLYFQVPVTLSPGTGPLPHPSRSGALYDAWFEPLATTLGLTSPDPSDIDVDLYGMKPLEACTRPWLLTRRPCRHVLRGYREAFRPLELNVRLGLEAESGGERLRLAARGDVDPAPASAGSFVGTVPFALARAIRARERESVLRNLHARWGYRLGRFLSALLDGTKAFLGRKPRR